MLICRQSPNKLHSNSSFLSQLLGTWNIVSHRNNFRAGGSDFQIWPKKPQEYVTNFTTDPDPLFRIVFYYYVSPLLGFLSHLPLSWKVVDSVLNIDAAGWEAMVKGRGLHGERRLPSSKDSRVRVRSSGAQALKGSDTHHYI